VFLVRREIILRLDICVENWTILVSTRIPVIVVRLSEITTIITLSELLLKPKLV